MIAVARMAMLDLRTVAPHRYQGLAVFGVCLLFLTHNPVVFVPALVLLLTSQVAAHPFLIADKAGLETLYAMLPLRRRTVIYGHYAWAVASFVATAAVGTALTLLLARIQSAPLGGRTLLTVLTLSWAVFVVNVAIQFPLFVRFGYSRISLLSTFLPLALVMMALARLHLTIVTFAELQTWLPLLWVAGAAALVASVAVAVTADHRRVRNGAAAPGRER
ncbi:ABC-2 transporter permease [Actinoplanes sp. NPDC026623]|uniref:ABC-2 transporter permease n=1 Tax=Actinoplanes sp. NPDC026623 TaxID=3155610 RepID=UPI0033ED32E4